MQQLRESIVQQLPLLPAALPVRPKPLAICGRGQGSTPGSFNECTAVHALNALVGNINKKGGIFAVAEPDYINWPEVEMDATAASGMQKDRLDGRRE